MEFSGQYLTYEEYKGLGGTLDLTPFNLLEFEARKRIDIRTFDRLKKSENIPQEIKICEFKMIESINGYSETTNKVAKNGNVASEGIDGYSVSYLTAGQISEVIKSKSVELDEIIRTYLSGVIVNNEHLLYCGVK